MGKEGRQAVRCSDFAFAKFRFLRRALLVHGHWYYTRICMVILYCFYKNVAFITAQVFFTFQSAYSTEVKFAILIISLHMLISIPHRIGTFDCFSLYFFRVYVYGSSTSKSNWRTKSLTYLLSDIVSLSQKCQFF